MRSGSSAAESHEHVGRQSLSIVTEVTASERLAWHPSRSFLARLTPGYDGECDPGIGVELFHDAADIILNGAFGKEHGIGDLPIAHALGDELQYPLFLVVQGFSSDGAAVCLGSMFGCGGQLSMIANRRWL